MKIYSLILVTIFALSAQAGGAKRDGFLKKTNDVALVLEYQSGSDTCFVLVGKLKLLSSMVFTPPKMTVNAATVTTKMIKIENQTSSRKYEAAGTDVAGEAFKIVDKKVAQVYFCADLTAVAKATSYNVTLELPDAKKGSVEVPNLN